MKTGKFNIVTDGAWGSCGKGLITTALAARHLPNIISTTNMANAGHTAVSADGRKFVAKALPSAAILGKWMHSAAVGKSYSPWIIVGATAAFNLQQMLNEIKECQVEETTIIHERAAV